MQRNDPVSDGAWCSSITPLELELSYVSLLVATHHPRVEAVWLAITPHLENWIRHQKQRAQA